MGKFDYTVDQDILLRLDELDHDNEGLKNARPLHPRILERMRAYFQIQHIYHSNALEGNSLTLAETELVVREGITIGGKPLKDHLEATNLSFALGYVEALVAKREEINERVVKELHRLVLKEIDDENAGNYRAVPVRISGSEHRPPEPILVPEEMEEFLQWYETESTLHPVIKGCVAHLKLVEIHPFYDGNGRTARLLLNLHLLRHDYPPAIIRKEERPAYFNALENARTGDISAFAALVAERVRETLREYLSAIRQEERAKEWAANIADRSRQVAHKRRISRYKIWKRFMETFRREFRARVDLLHEKRPEDVHIATDEFEIIDFEKYQDLVDQQTATLTWFFKMAFLMRERPPEKFVFFFGWPSYEARRQIGNDEETVSLFVSKRYENQYRRLQEELISLREIFIDGPEIKALLKKPKCPPELQAVAPGEIAEQFIEEVLKHYFGF